MRGTIDSAGTVTIVFNMQAEHLPAPGMDRMWLPCEQCGGLQNVELNTVAVVCDPCAADQLDLERVEQLTYRGRVLCEQEEGAGTGTVCFALHCIQTDDQDSYLQGNVERWLKRGLRDVRGLG